MSDPACRSQTVVVRLPREIDIANAADVYASLFGAIAPGTRVLVADMTSTSFCDSAGIGEIMLVRRSAMRGGVEFRMVVPRGGVLRVLQLQGLDQVVQLFLTLEAALDR